jgi:hypothetical protein
MKLFLFILTISIGLTAMIVSLTSCDHSRVMRAYHSNNPHARELLHHGFNLKVAEYIDSDLIKNALKGDTDAKEIIFAQMELLRAMPKERTRIYPPVHIQGGLY